MEIVPGWRPASSCSAKIRGLLAAFLVGSIQAASAAGVPAVQKNHVPASSGLVLTPCRLPDVAQQARCGALEAPEDPARPQGRRLSIHVAVLPASGGTASKFHSARCTRSMVASPGVGSTAKRSLRASSSIAPFSAITQPSIVA